MSWHATRPGEEAVETIRLRAAAARTKGDVVRIGVGHTDGARVDITLADDTNVYTVAVANQDIASGSIGEYVVKGTVQCTVTSDTYTAGHGLHILNGTVLNSDAVFEAYTGVVTLNDFAQVEEAGTAVTTIRATLTGRPFTAQT